MPQNDPAEFRPARESSMWFPVIVIAAVLAAAFGWWRWSQQREAPPEAPTTQTAPQPPSAPAEAPPQPPVVTGPQNPMDNLAEPEKALPALSDADAHVASALNDLLGRKNVTSFLQLDGFVRRAVATVDNLPREHATARMWPVLPTPQRFTVQGNGEVKTISPDNGARYTPFVLFVESIDPARAVALYARLYPLFQEAYEELGYPNRYFNDRLVAVLDHLLKTPEPAGPVQVKITEVKGEMPLENPWTRYEFADPQLEALSAGQKLLIRMGPVNERRMKARLAELRRLVATGTIAKK